MASMKYLDRGPNAVTTVCRMGILQSDRNGEARRAFAPSLPE